MNISTPPILGRNNGFSLVELSIVLVILGLLTGGILTGQSLIKAAQLRAVPIELTSYQIAVSSFKDKYFALPGDMSNATLFWGKLAAHCNGEAGTAQATGTCNGNGSYDYSDNAAAAGQESERHMVWQHMALAGMIEGAYTGLAGPGSADDSILGQNVPSSKYPNAGWDLETLNNAGTGQRYAMDYGNTLKFAARRANSELDGFALSPGDAWNVDKKVDDGNPGKGRVITFWNTCSDATSNTDYDSNYTVNATTIGCVLHFLHTGE